MKLVARAQIKRASAHGVNVGEETYRDLVQVSKQTNYSMKELVDLAWAEFRKSLEIAPAARSGGASS